MSKPIKQFKGDFAFLSNFWYTPIELSGEIYPTLEHAYQAAKTFDAEERAVIRAAETPGQAKRLGRKVTLRPHWDQVNLAVMHKLLLQKFWRSPLRDGLLATRKVKLIEGNDWGDTFWGVCNGVGENWLGCLLMLVRSRLRSEPDVPPIEIPLSLPQVDTTTYPMPEEG